MLLLSDGVGLRQPLAKLGVDVLRLLDAENVHVIARRNGLDAPKPWAVTSPGENDVSVEPPASRRHLRERHSHLERDATFLGDDRDRSNVANCIDNRIEEGANRPRLAFKMIVQVVAPARVRLVSIRELPTASLAAPHP